MFSTADPFSTARPILVKNTSATDAPAYAALQVIGIDAGSGTGDQTRGAIRIQKPNADSLDPNLILVNGGTPIKAGDWGVAYMESPWPVLVYTTGGSNTDAFGDQLGTVSGQWYLKNDRFGFRSWGSLYESQVPGSAAISLAIRGYRALIDIACVSNVLTGTKPTSGGGNG